MKRILSWAYPLVLVVAIGSIPWSLQAGEFEGIPKGTDYLFTQPGTFVGLPGIGTLPLSGVPDPAHGGADTIVQRLNDANLPDVNGSVPGVATVNTMMTELQLTSAPGAVGGLTMMVNLAAPSLGQITFTQTVNGEGIPEGTFSSFFDVNFTLSFQAPTGGPINCTQLLPAGVCTQTVLLNGTGNWTDDKGALWLVGNSTYSSPTENHVVSMAPEPSFTILIAAGLGGLALLKRRRLS